MNPMPAPTRGASPRRLVIDYPDPDTLAIVREYARRRRLDEPTAAEHLIVYGARTFIRALRAGRKSAESLTPEARSAKMQRASTIRWERERARLRVEYGIDAPPRTAGEAP